MNGFRWYMPTEVVMGVGSLDSLGERVGAFGRRPLFVTGRSSARKSGALDKVQAQFPNAPVFDAVEENPCTETCEAGAEVCREHDCDVVVGIGGGSPMDTAKAIAMLACNPGRCENYYGRDVFKQGNLPILAVPTTAGTGSEVTPYAVITHRATGYKRTIGGQTLFPRVALLDPALSVTMPASVTASTGLDALSQAMEGMVSLKSTPLGDALALETCRVVHAWLARAVAEPDDLEARGQMLYAAMLSGCIIAQSGTTLLHGMGYYFTLDFGLAHGLANALLLTPLFQHNAAYLPAKVAEIATALGHPAEPTPEDAEAKIALAIRELAQAAGVSLAGKDAGIEADSLRGFAEDISADPYRFKNQVGDLSVDEVYRFFRAAFDGPS